MDAEQNETVNVSAEGIKQAEAAHADEAQSGAPQADAPQADVAQQTQEEANTHSESVVVDPAALEALLFVTDEPVKAKTLATLLECDESEVKQALLTLQEELASSVRGIQLNEVANAWQLSTKPVYHALLERYVSSWDTRKLSSAAIETLAIVAYAQPVTRAMVSSVRGINSDSSISSLVEKGLVKEVGTSDALGHPTLYGTTTNFLQKFGLANIKELPNLKNFAPDEETRAYIYERIGAVHEDSGQVIETDENNGEFSEGAFENNSAKFSHTPSENNEASYKEFSEGDVREQKLRESSLTSPSENSKTFGTEEFSEGDIRESSQDEASEAFEQAKDMLVEKMQEVVKERVADSLASASGAVEKIDFSKLKFETDDE